MKDELIPAMNQALASAETLQYGYKNVLIQNESGGSININIQTPSLDIRNAAEVILAMHSFSHEYYQLLVTADNNVFKCKTISVPACSSLVKDTVPPEIFERCSSLEEEGIRELKTFPALICIQNRDFDGQTSPDEIGVFGYIKSVQKCGHMINIAFGILAPVSHSILCDKKNAVYYDLNMSCGITSLNRLEWTVHRIDLFEAFDKTGVNYPKL